MKTVDCQQNDTSLRVVDGPYDENIWLYDQTEDKRYRFVLGTRGKRPLLCFGVNPSTASPVKLDKTMRNVEFFAKKKDFDSYIMLNLYPQRATMPRCLDQVKSCFFEEQNFEAIRTVFSRYEELNILAAWGVTIEKRPYLAECLKEIVRLSRNYDCKWLSLGLTKAGHPRHPSRLSHDAELLPFDVEGYAARFDF